MSKARDLANAGTALTTVSATELGYLDGVTSAVQTQLDAKAIPANVINNTLADAKGDLITATADNTPARLAVGSNGDTLVADSSTSTGLRYTAGTVQSNPVLNSAFQIWQRTTSQAFTSGQSFFVADRWKCFAAGNASVVSRQLTNDTTNLPNIQYALRFQRNSGQTSTSPQYVANSFETINSIPYAGKAVTLSFYARAGANYSATSNALLAYLYSGTGTDQNWIDVAYTGQATVASGTATLTTTWQRFTYTGTVATSATELALVFQSGPTGTAGANDYFEVTGVQIDVGSVALPFRTYAATIQGELAACQRYYWRQTANQNYSMFAQGSADSSTLNRLLIQFPVTMRAVPTALDYSSLANYDGVTVIAVTLAVFGSQTQSVNTMDIAATSSGLTQYRPYKLLANNSTSAFIGFSAEL
jgi:hypothetical protein